MSDGLPPSNPDRARQVGLTRWQGRAATSAWHRQRCARRVRRCRTMDLYRTAESLPSRVPLFPFPAANNQIKLVLIDCDTTGASTDTAATGDRIRLPSPPSLPSPVAISLRESIRGENRSISLCQSRDFFARNVSSRQLGMKMAPSTSTMTTRIEDDAGGDRDLVGVHPSVCPSVAAAGAAREIRFFHA